MQDLSVTIFQQDLAWQDAPANRAQFACLLPAAAGSALIVLPEMFATGFSIETKITAEPEQGTTEQFLIEIFTSLRKSAVGLMWLTCEILVRSFSL